MNFIKILIATIFLIGSFWLGMLIFDYQFSITDSKTTSLIFTLLVSTIYTLGGILINGLIGMCVYFVFYVFFHDIDIKAKQTFNQVRNRFHKD